MVNRGDLIFQMRPTKVSYVFVLGGGGAMLRQHCFMPGFDGHGALHKDAMIPAAGRHPYAATCTPNRFTMGSSDIDG